jgi:uncharacterized protein with ACT and thioredoxin-like domain
MQNTDKIKHLQSLYVQLIIAEAQGNIAYYQSINMDENVPAFDKYTARAKILEEVEKIKSYKNLIKEEMDS